MNYTKTKNLITITNPQDFNVDQTLNCGQIFRYHIDGKVATVYSKDKMAVLTTQNDMSCSMKFSVEFTQPIKDIFILHLKMLIL